MLFHSYKIAHIFSATLVLTSMAYCFYLWVQMLSAENKENISQQIQKQTWLIIMPFAMIQLLTGFAMISVQKEDFSQFWIQGSVIGFVLAMVSWFGFIYFLLSEQQYCLDDCTTNERFFRRAQTLMLSVCVLALLGMIFLMTNRI